MNNSKILSGGSGWLAAALLLLTLAGCDDNRPGIPVNVPTPLMNTVGTVAIAGNPIIGSTLTAAVTDANGTGSVSYQWAADGTDISGAMNQTYVVTNNELGAMLTVTATYTDNAGFAESPVSAATAAVTAPPNQAGTIAVSGVPTVGETLTATVADANGIASSTIGYQWAADGTDIGGATAETYTLTSAEAGTMVTVSAAYTDDDGYAEMPVSAAVGPIGTTVSNVAGTVAIGGMTVVGQDLTATITDPNGVSGTVSYQWLADGVNIAGATSATYTLTTAERAALISVTVSYTDDDNFAEGPLSATAGDIVYSAIVTNEAALVAAAAAAVDGDVIGLDSAAGGDYIDMAEIEFAANMLQIQKTANSTAVISGKTCLVFSGDGIVVDGLVFDTLDWVGGGLCDANGDGSVYLSGTDITLQNSQFLGEASPRTVPSSDPYHYVAVKGLNNVIERNLFQGKDMDNEGSAITMFADTSVGVNQGHTIQYNLFRDFPGKSGVATNRDSTAHAIQVGRTTGDDAQGDGLFTIQYNRFDMVQSERRLMRVQSSSNTIQGNTVVDSYGLIALEDGYGNTVTRNVILSAGDDGDDGGISFAPLGHTVTENYINNLRTTSSQRGGLVINSDPLDGSGNGAILATPGLDFTVTVASNTIVNARRAIIFEDADCAVFAPILDFDENLVMNQSTANSINGNDNGAGQNAVTDSDFVGVPCSIDPGSDFDNNHFYSAMLSQSGSFDFNGAAADNVSGDEDMASFTQDGDGLVNGAGPDAGIGVDTSVLYVIQESQVGPGTTWTSPDDMMAPPNQTGTVTIAGIPAVGETLTATVSDGNGTTTSTIAYQWAADGVDIAGATSDTYVVAAGDDGALLTVIATYTDDNNNAEAIVSAPVGPVTATAMNVTGTVSISGTPEVGETLTATVNDPNGTTTSTIAYQWAADGTDITGATADTYVLTASEVGANITVNASYTDDDAFAESIVSDPVGPVTAAPTNTAGAVTISGTTTVGQTLTATVTDANGTTTSTIAYQWAADGTDIIGATSDTYVLTASEVGSNITVSASYTDDDGFAESAISGPVGPVMSGASNMPGSVSISGTTLVGQALTATVSDGNGASGTIAYQWQADGGDIPGATANTYTLTAAERGATISVNTSYTDDDSFAETPSATAADIVYSAIVTGEISLLNAVGAAADGDVIGLDSASGGDDYADMTEVALATGNVQMRRTVGSTAVISGATCLAFTGDDIVVDGLVFDTLDWLSGSTCDSQGDGSVFIGGDSVTLRSSQFLGEAAPRTVPSGDAYHYITVKGIGNLIERNLFEGKDMDNEGSIISIFADPSAMNNEGHTIQYNLFRNILGKSGVTGNRDSTAHALQIGRSTGNDSTGIGGVTVQYNRFENIESERRIMRVQSGGNLIQGNTFVNTLGMIALEDGYASTVMNNIILSAGVDGDDGGISFAPLGHTVTDNYINNMRTTSGQRASLLLNPDPLSGDGNTALIAAPPGDFTVTVARNTIVNAQQAIQFEDADCGLLPALLDFDDNFIVNQTSASSINGNTNGSGRNAVTDDDWDVAGCSLNPASTFAGNRFYSANLSASGMFDFNGNLAGNTVGAQDSATFTQDGTVQPYATGGLVSGSGPDAGVGVDTSTLTLIEDTQVGPGSTWISP